MGFAWQGSFGLAVTLCSLVPLLVGIVDFVAGFADSSLRKNPTTALCGYQAEHPVVDDNEIYERSKKSKQEMEQEEDDEEYEEEEDEAEEGSKENKDNDEKGDEPDIARPTVESPAGEQEQNFEVVEHADAAPDAASDPPPAAGGDNNEQQ
jgi:hypothetical protein